LTGKITDPRDLEHYLTSPIHNGKSPLKSRLKGDANCQKGGTTELIKGPNIQSLPLFEALPDTLEVPILLKWEMIFLLMVF
jgi:aconitate hydratase